MKTVFAALKKVFHNKKYFFLWFLFTTIFFWIFVLIPVFITPLNTLGLQLTLLKAKDYVINVGLSLSIGLMIVMQVHAFRQARQRKSKLKLVSQGGVSSYVGFAGAMASTGACPACIATLFGYLGSSGAFFLVNHSNWVLAVSFALIAISIYFTARKIEGTCETCVPKEPASKA